MGDYEKIHPMDGDADEVQTKYNEIMKAVYNFEAEVQIRKLQKGYGEGEFGNSKGSKSSNPG